MQNGPVWAKSIIDSFQQAAGTLLPNNIGTRPADVFDLGFSLAIKIFDKISFWSPGDSLGYVIAGYMIMIIFALIAAMMLLVIVQSYIVLYAGIILLGFGGSIFTKDIALMYLKAAISIGAKYFIMLLVAGLGADIINNWALALTNITFKQMALFIGASTVLLALVKTIPDMIGDMINGFSWGTGESLTRTTMQMGKMAIGAGVGAVTGAVGGTMAVSEAAKLSSATSSGGLASKVGGTVSNLAKAGAQDAASRLSGQHRGQGTTGGRMSALLKEQRLSTTTKSEPKDEPYHSDALDLSKTGSIYKDEK